MSRKRRVSILLLLVGGACIAIGLMVWRFAGPFGPSRHLVGGWQVKVDAEEAQKEGTKRNSTERVFFNRDGTYRFVTDLPGMTTIVEGTWRVSETSGNELLVTVRPKVQIARFSNGHVSKKPLDDIIEMVLTVVEGDRLSVTVKADNGVADHFELQRLED